ncbi:sensor histidine kinase [Aquabacterium sp.]|uniref:sensor histidine kinase n=1 Tax=Aquabacterium sp. TaxID=1872578 RepID=UPI003784E068
MKPAHPSMPAAAAPAAAWQRWWYAGLDEPTRAQALAFDRRLLRREGLGLWLGIALGWAATAVGLQQAGMTARWAWFTSALFVAGSGLAMRRAWLQPQKFDARTLRRLAVLMVVATYAGALGTMFAGVWDAGGPPGWEKLLRALWRATPVQLLAGMALLLMLWAVATGRRAQIQRALQQSQLVAERDAAARHAAEARLQLLQAQIQPHFIFNTLAALQHWVDTGDARAPALLRALTQFLRGSTELLAREQATLGDELALARHYLAIVQARLGERLHPPAFAVADDCLAQALPPGLLLTLLENAVEHGVAPALQSAGISVRAQRSAGRFELTVLNSGQPLAPDWREGVGLANCRERLQHRFGDAARLSLQATEAGTLARVTIEGPAA